MSEQDQTPSEITGWPTWASRVAAVFGPPNSEGFGSATFFDEAPTAALPEAAKDVYRRFVGDLWERWGEEAWTGPWREVFARSGEGDVVAELRALTDADAARSTVLILEHPAGLETIGPALVDGFGAPQVADFRVFNIGDGEAMSGLLLAARRAESGQDVYLAVLMD